MKRMRPRWPVQLGALLAGPVLMTACAQIPRSPVTEAQFPSLSCAELAQETRAAVTTKAVADEARSDAWHAVLPFVVAARYVHAGSASSEAERRISLLAEHASRTGCNPADRLATHRAP